MTAVAGWYGLALKGQWSSVATHQVQYLADTIKVMLTDVGYVPDQDAHEFISDVTNEITNTSGSAYVAGGQALSSKTLTYDTSTNEVRLDAADPQWTSASFSLYRAVVYKDTGTPTTSPLMGYVDFGSVQTVGNGIFQIVWDATGMMKVTAA